MKSLVKPDPDKKRSVVEETPSWDDNPCGFCEDGMCDECDCDDCTCRANDHNRIDEA
jgi:hypothetical protein